MKKQAGMIPVIFLIMVPLLLAAGGVIYYLKSSQALRGNKAGPEQESTMTASQDQIAEPTGIVTSPPAETNNQLVDWQEYFNEKYQYKVKYPPNWYFDKNACCPPPPAGISITSTSTKEYQPNKSQAGFHVFVDEALGRTLENYEEIQSLESQYYQKIPITVSGEKAVKLQVPDKSSNNASIYVLHGNYMYRLDWIELNGAQEEENFQEIVNNFTFTN